MIDPAVPMLATCPACAAAVHETPDPVSGTVRCGGCGVQFDPRQDATAAAPGPGVETPWQPAMGDELGAYTLLDQLGRGGMATVFKARQASLERPVAVKILHAHLAADPDLVRRFHREAEALVQVAHPRIVPVLDRGEHRGRPYLVTALCGERTLRDDLVAGPMAPHRVAAIASQLLEALAHAHRRGLVHRDLKPENVIIDPQGAAYLADFGIAQVGRALDGHTLTQLTRTDVVMGTIAYMAPEQAAGSRSVDGRCDLYALGVVCYEALTGHLPQGRFEDPSEHLPELPPEQRAAWDRFVLALLERDPQRRPESAAAARQLLAPLHPTTAEHEAAGARDGRRRYRFGPVVIDLPDDLPDTASRIFARAERESGSSLDEAREELREARAEVEQAYREHPGAPGQSIAMAAMDLAERAVSGQAAARHAEDADPGAAQPQESAREPTPGLMRARDNRWIAGVCGGLGAWLGIAPGWLRLGLAVGPALTGGIGYLPVIIGYLIACLAIGESRGPYRPRPLNARLPARPEGWVLGVCALLAERTALSAGLWRLITLLGLPFGTWIAYLVLGIVLPPAPRRRAPPPLPPEDEHRAETVPAQTQPDHQRPRRFWALAAVGTAAWALVLGSNGLPEYAFVLWWLSGIAGLSAVIGHRGDPERPASDAGGGFALGLGAGLLALIAAIAAHIEPGRERGNAVDLLVLVLAVLGIFFLQQLAALLRQRHALTGQLLALVVGLALASLVPLARAAGEPALLVRHLDPVLLTVVFGVGGFAVSAMLLDVFLRWLTSRGAGPARRFDLPATLIGVASLGVLVLLLTAGGLLLDEASLPDRLSLQGPSPFALVLLVLVAGGALVGRWRGPALVLGGAALAVAAVATPQRATLVSVISDDLGSPELLVEVAHDGEFITISPEVRTRRYRYPGTSDRAETTIDYHGERAGWSFQGRLEFINRGGNGRLDELILHDLRVTTPQGEVLDHRDDLRFDLGSRSLRVPFDEDTRVNLFVRDLGDDPPPATPVSEGSSDLFESETRARERAPAR